MENDNDIEYYYEDVPLLEVELTSDTSFLTIRETLTRIGIPGSDKTLYQSCHILHKQGRYYIVHFKELFRLDGRDFPIPVEDIQRRNTIACLLEQWGLCRVVRKIEPEEKMPVARIKILKHSEASEWKLQPKYRIGRKE